MFLADKRAKENQEKLEKAEQLKLKELEKAEQLRLQKLEETEQLKLQELERAEQIKLQELEKERFKKEMSKKIQQEERAYMESVLKCRQQRRQESAKTTPKRKKKPTTNQVHERKIRCVVMPDEFYQEASLSSSKPSTSCHNNSASTPVNNNYSKASSLNVSNQPSVQQVKYYNNVPTQHMHYGTRLILNEPVLLPKSVATIAPITTTLQQIAAQARRPPFVSKKAQEYLAYQDARKFDDFFKTYQILLKMTKLLNTEDLLNLRLVNGTWKSIVDTNPVWKSITLTKNCQVKDWSQFFKYVISRFGTEDITFDDYVPNLNNIVDMYKQFGDKVQRLNFKTKSARNNRLAMELLCNLNELSSSIQFKQSHIVWQVQVTVDDIGSCLVPVDQSDENRPSKVSGIACGRDYGRVKEGDNTRSSPVTVVPYCYRIKDPSISFSGTRTVPEICDIEDLFNGKRYDLSKAHSLDKPVIEVKPI